MHCLHAVGLLYLLLSFEFCACFEQLMCSRNLSDSQSFCLSSTYKKDIKPDTGHPLEIFVHLDIEDILDINDYDKTITLKLYMSISWTDHRLRLLPQSSDWVVEDGDENWTRINPLWLQHIWIPDVDIVNMRDFKTAHFFHRGDLAFHICTLHFCTQHGCTLHFCTSHLCTVALCTFCT